MINGILSRCSEERLTVLSSFNVTKIKMRRIQLWKTIKNYWQKDFQIL